MASSIKDKTPISYDLIVLSVALLLLLFSVLEILLEIMTGKEKKQYVEKLGASKKLAIIREEKTKLMDKYKECACLRSSGAITNFMASYMASRLDWIRRLR